MRRRQFLIGAGAVGAILLIARVAFNFFNQRNILISDPLKPKLAESALDQGDEWVYVGDGPDEVTDSAYSAAKAHPGRLVGLNIKTQKRSQIDLPFVPHELAPCPTNKTLAACSHKWGVGAALVDLKANAILKIIAAPAGVRYFGHLAWAPDGDTIYFSAQNDAQSKGQILVYSISKNSFVASFDTDGYLAHQLIYNVETANLEILNSATLADNEKHERFSSLNSIDSKNGNIVERRPLQTQGFAHFSYDNNRKTFYCGGQYDSDGDQLSQLSELAAHSVQNIDLSHLPTTSEGTVTETHGDVLSLVSTSCDFGDKLLFTIPKSNDVVVYDKAKRKVESVYVGPESPRGLAISAYDPKLIYMNSKNGLISLLKLAKNKAGNTIIVPSVQFRLGNGSHATLVKI